MGDELSARIDRLESRHEIEALVSNYCHGFDKRDFGRFLSIWWRDCVWKIGPPLAISVATTAFTKPFIKSSGPPGRSRST